MSKWLERVHVDGGEGNTRCANSAGSAISCASEAIGPNGANGMDAVPASVVMGLRRLAGPAPRTVRDEGAWGEVVADARRLADEGWAASALALGWSPLDLWGYSPDRDGLAVWLRGRGLVLLDAATAVVVNGTGRAQFTRDRAGMPGATLLWELR